jgi:hypothetical protein
MRMMVAPLVLLALIAAAIAGPNDVLHAGKYYRDAVVDGFVGDKADVRSRDGKVLVPFASLPAALKEKYRAEYERIAEKAKETSAAEREFPGSIQMTGDVKYVQANGVLLDKYVSRPIASSMARIGGGGRVVMSMEPSGSLAYIEGLKGVTEKENVTVRVRSAGAHVFKDRMGVSRTVEKWILLRREDAKGRAAAAAPVAAAAAPTAAPAQAVTPEGEYKKAYEFGFMVGKNDATEGKARDGQKAMRLGQIHAKGNAYPAEYAKGFHEGYNQGWHARKIVVPN